MKKRIILILTVLIVFTGLSFPKKRKVDSIKFPALKNFSTPIIEKSNINNGIKLRLIKTDKLPLVNIVAIIKGGSVYDPSNKVGIAEMTAQLLRIGGVKGMSGEEVDAFLDANGITINISASLEDFTVYMSCLDENLEKAFEILSKIIRTPGFDKKKLEEIKTQYASSVQRRNDNPQPILSREFDKVVYGKHTPFSSVLEYEHIDNISMRDIKDEYNQFFAPNNILMGVSGPVDLKNVEGLIIKYLGNWKNRASIPAYPKVRKPNNDFKIAIANKDNLNQNYISVGNMGLMMDKKSEAAIKVFNSIFSQGMDSRLFNKVRTKLGLTYGISGGIVQNEWYPGKVYFSTFTKSESTIPVIKAIFEEIDRIKKEKVSDEELKNAKDYFLNSYVFKFSSPEKVLYSKLSDEFYGEEENAQQKLLEDIKKVTKEDIYKIAQKYLHPEEMKIVIVGNEKLIKGKLSDFGKVKKLDISIKAPVVKEVIPMATPESLKKGTRIIARLYKKKYRGYKKLKSMEIVYDMTMNIPGRGNMTLGMKTSMVYPDKTYTEISVMGMKMTEVVNGNKGIMNQMGRKIKLGKKQLEERRFGTEYDMYHNHKNYKFQYLKEVKIKGKTYDLIYVFNSDKKWKKIFINKKTGLIEITESMSKQAPMIGVIRSVSSNFKTIKGIPFAFKEETLFKNKVVRTVNMKSVKVNPRIDKKLFVLEK